MTSSLVGSEMCIRDRGYTTHNTSQWPQTTVMRHAWQTAPHTVIRQDTNTPHHAWYTLCNVETA
eukprot:11023438-Prorocentrum_lima.AAC.1